MQFTTGYEEKIFNEATYFVAVRGKGKHRIRTECTTFNEAKEFGSNHSDKRTMIYAVNELGSAAHICNV